MDLGLFLGLVEDSNAATVSSDPDLVANKLSGNFVKGPSDFEPLRLPEESTRAAHLFARRDRRPCPRRDEASALRIVAA